VTEEMLEDVAQIRSYIDARLRLGVELAEEDELLNGSGVAPHLLGLKNRVGLAADVVRGAAENNADAIFRQIMAIFSASFLMPSGIAMNPADWATTALMKTTTGEYLTGGPFASIQTPTLWGLSVAVTPVQAATVAMVGAYKQAAQIFRKGGIRVEASNSHVDFFIKNLVAIRAEERLALAVYRPAAFGEVTSLGVPA
jgi:HK97 family phage major capsid protein